MEWGAVQEEGGGDSISLTGTVALLSFPASLVPGAVPVKAPWAS